MKLNSQPEAFCTDSECFYYRTTKNIYNHTILTQSMKEYRDRWGLLTVI